MSRRDDVLAALKAAGEAGVSGEALARELAVSRVAVSKHVCALRDLGYRIEGEPGRGYVLLGVPDLLLPGELRPLVDSQLWTRLEGGPETGSTNDDCKLLAREGADEGTVVVAGRQTAGRGRLGRMWESPGGGAYLSALLRPGLSLGELAPLPLAVGIAIARALDALGAGDVGLKWPNDVWLSGSKVAGVLIEISAESDRVEWVVAGIGVNVLRDEGAREDAAYVRDVVGEATPASVAAAVLGELAEVYAQFQLEGFRGLAREYGSRSVLADREVKVCDVGGRVRATGHASGIDDLGRLVVETSRGSVAVAAGDVTLVGSSLD
ncbi:MAG: biotin--[acetyl-CoA-carboxylase] ligase [Actinomycetota bacterium]|nr:biotin--[acetyl-CoA-carboxylase] ligase [Actinomycetota bacterium]